MKLNTYINLVALLTLLLLGLTAFPTYANSLTIKDQCKKDAWKLFNNPTFKNQGDCVSFVQSSKPIPTPVLVDTVVIDPTKFQPTYSHISLNSGENYLFTVSGTYTNRNGSEQIDAEYVSEDNWLTKFDGLPGWPLNDYWNELDLMVNNNFVDWLELSPAVANTYNYNYIGTGNTVNFMVFDGSPDLKVINEGWYTDNLGGALTVNIYKI